MRQTLLPHPAQGLRPKRSGSLLPVLLAPLWATPAILLGVNAVMPTSLITFWVIVKLTAFGLCLPSLAVAFALLLNRFCVPRDYDIGPGTSLLSGRAIARRAASPPTIPATTAGKRLSMKSRNLLSSR